MKKLMVLGVVILGLAGATTLLLTKKSDNSTPSTVAQTKAKSTQTPACLKKNPQLTLNAADQAAIEEALVMQIIDVPAGTQTDINYTTYTAARSTGTEFYPGDYGKYNFVAEKRGSNWKVTSFDLCKV